MVGSAINPPPQANELAPLTEEEEFLKRNTDCVYFLASPLTCKKGSECEYRHSDIARVNPRDCYYWLNGNCLNPKCAFRHPPLDGLLGAEVPGPVGPAVPQAPVKQGVACIFFQKGYCLKGHFCPFLHGPPNVVNNSGVQPTPPKPVNKPSKVDSAGPDNYVQEQKSTHYGTVQKPVESLPSQTNQVPKLQLRNGGGVAVEKKVAPPHEEPSRYKPASVTPPPVMNDFQLSRCNRGVHETDHVSDNEEINGKDVEEYSREPTPGFDVLVDNEADDSEYYPNEEGFGRSVDYDVDRDMYPEKRDVDHYNKEGYAWEDYRENSNFGRKRYPRDESPNQFEHSDLRHRLSKQRGDNVGGLRSVISREHFHDNRDDRIVRDSHHDRRLDSGPLSSRLRGRIKIPGRSTSPGYENGSRVEREINIRRQHRSRYSPERPPHVSSNHSRFRDRITGRSNDDYNNQRRDYRGYGGNSSEFNGPKRWSESKSQQVDDGQTLGKRKYPRPESQQSEVNLSFEGPKPLSEILKRKRGSVISSTINEDNYSNGDNQKERTDIPSGNTVNADNEKSTNGQSSFDHKPSAAENKVGSVDEDALLDQELEAYDQRDGEYEYEQIDGEDYNLEEGEEYMEEEDETATKE
ncbi:hypothetical protein M8C21_005918 [Ambrosia artemisiifolia]|uniref:C3H1-type domain-containing protein n=1 Tax=Ambrosia artemisiifolia TaxID=4212 RepID=A0AAD5CV70_AMBAR|nr:hypothetical protein M8C21_005918 [Ambrosia artemisiifolia]